MKVLPTIILILFFCTLGGKGNSQNVDSLKQTVDDLLEKKQSGFIKEEVKAIIELADLLGKSNNEQSLFYIRKVLSFTKEIEDNHFSEMDALVTYADGLSYANKLDSCVSILKQAINDFEGKSTDSVFINQIGTLYQTLGLAYRDKGDFLEAAKTLNTAAVHFDNGGDKKQQLAAKYNQANLLTRLNNFQQAEKSYNELLQLSENPVVHGVVYSSLGILNMKQEKYDEALAYLLKCKELIDYAREPELVYLNLGIVYRDLEKYSLSEENFIEAEKICEATKRKRVLILIYNGFVKLYGLTGNLDKEEQYLNLVQESISPSNFSEQTVLYESKSRISSKKGDWKNAYDFLKLKQIYRDSIESIERLEAITEIETKYQTEKKETEIELLNKEKALQVATIRNQKIMIVGGLIGSGLLGLLAFLFYRQNKERKKNNQQLMEKSEKINLLHKELSHRVKNNLAFVSSLMKMQGRRLENEEAKSAVKEGQTRIEAMSLLHRKLFINEENSNVNIKEYLEELSASLNRTYSSIAEQPSIKLEVSNMEIGGETAVRLGLIVNELMTNSFKYAFKNQPSPEIFIGLKSSENGDLTLDYKDNGIGLPETLNISNTTSLGLKLINTLTKQLKGTLQLNNEDGARFQFYFQNPKIAD